MRFKLLRRACLIVVATLLTQVGGIVLVISWIIASPVNARWDTRFPKLTSTGIFLALYLLTSLYVLPPLARLNGRVALPFFGNSALAPRTMWTVVLNRHYADEELLEVLSEVSRAFNAANPSARVLYLDACFPFFDGFPLLPHLSHNDGRKVDLAFVYHRAGSNTPVASTPSAIGYGALEQPRQGEDDPATRCREQGSWWYEALGFLPLNDELSIHEDLTAALVRMIADHPRTGKVFIEPFLKTRWHISSTKVRFHGCHAVSHADHIHVQL